jgi:phospholipase C
MLLRRLARFAPALAVALALVPSAPAAAGRLSTADPVLMRLGGALPGVSFPMPVQSSGGKIKHVVIIMQENRAFDDLFQGYPGADTRSYGFDQQGNKITLQPVPLEAPYDIEHDIYGFIVAYDNGKMDGFSNEGVGGSYGQNPMYGYVPHSESQIYFNMAGQYVLGDRMFTSHIDDSFISHQYLIAGQANHAAYFPSSTWGCDGGNGDKIATLNPNRSFGPSIVVCWDITTLGDEMDHAHKSWRFYASSIYGDGGFWSSYQAIRHIRYGPDWTKDVKNPSAAILTDVQNGYLANMTWVVPTCENSDHSGCGSNTGPAWVASVVNAIGQSKFWDSTAIFVMWDEWGGWYDHVPPPYVDYDGLGMRVPLLIISPYAKQGYVSHVQYEHGSLLRFAEDQFGLPRMTASDTRANSPAVDAFDFTQPPRAFTPFNTHLAPDYFLKQPPDLRIPDAE